MERKAISWEQAIKVVKFGTGAVLVLLAVIILAFATAELVQQIRTGHADTAFESFISNVLLVIIVLELAKTLFTYVENEEMYLHSIIEAAFIAVMRQVIMLEIESKPWTEAVALSALTLALGYVYYRMFRRESR